MDIIFGGVPASGKISIDTLLTIVLALGAFFSPVAVALLNTRDSKRTTITASRIKWLEESKNLIDSYVEQLNVYYEMQDKGDSTLLKTLNTITKNKNQLIMQYKPYSYHKDLFELEEERLQEHSTPTQQRLNIFKNWLTTYHKKDLTGDQLEDIFVNYLYKTEMILREAFNNDESPLDDIKYISEALPIVYSGVKKNEWDKISKNKKSYYNKIVLENLIALTDRYLEGLSRNSADEEELKWCEDTPSMQKELSNEFKLRKEETVPEYFERVFKFLDDKQFIFKEYSGKRKHKYLSFESPEGMINAKKFTQKNGKSFYYELNLSRSAAPTILKNIIEKGELR